jgi:FkbH-like protein
VAEALPEVLVPELPKDKMLYPEFLRRLDCFDAPALSDEDRERAAMYGAERERRVALESAQAVGSLDDWLETIELKVEAEPLNEANRQRTAQLLNKTNQMNLRTRRMTEVELSDWAHAPTRRMWTFRVADKFGDSGLTGIASLELDHDTALVADFVLSCRVMGKRVEETIVHQLVEGARALGASRLVAHYEPTKKNAPCLEFWQRSGFERSGERVFTWDLSRPYPKPRAVELRVAAG